MEEAAERLVDIAEDNAFEALTDAEDKVRRDAMTKFILSSKGRHRGWGTGGGNKGITLNSPTKGRMVISWEDGTDISGGANNGDDAKLIEYEDVECS